MTASQSSLEAPGVVDRPACEVSPLPQLIEAQKYDRREHVNFYRQNCPCTVVPSKMVIVNFNITSTLGPLYKGGGFA